MQKLARTSVFRSLRLLKSHNRLNIEKPSLGDVLCKVFVQKPSVGDLVGIRRFPLEGHRWVHSAPCVNAEHKAAEPLGNSKEGTVAKDTGSATVKRKKLKGKRAVVRWLKFFRWKKKKDYKRMTAEEKILHKLRKVKFYDKRILSRRLSCNKQGLYVKPRDQVRPVRRPRPSTREGCKAMMLVKVNKSGKWVVTRVVKDHTHPLIVSSGISMDERDMKIEQLTMELESEDQLCELYHELLLTLLDNVEEQTEVMSMKVSGIVNDVREFETEVERLPQNELDDN